jgi:hypothetical protein
MEQLMTTILGIDVAKNKSAIQRNPLVKALYDRLKAKSKNGMIIACACMKK